MTDPHMDISSTTNPRRYIIDIEVEIFVDAGLKAERPYDSRSKVFLSRLHILLGELKGVLQKRLPKGAGIVSTYSIFGDYLILIER